MRIFYKFLKIMQKKNWPALSMTAYKRRNRETKNWPENFDVLTFYL